MSSIKTSSTAVPAGIRCASKEESPNGVKNSVEPQVRQAERNSAGTAVPNLRFVDLKSKHIDTLQRIFDSYCPDAEIWAYGSRVDGNSHAGSDLDLVVMSFEPTASSCQIESGHEPEVRYSSTSKNTLCLRGTNTKRSEKSHAAACCPSGAKQRRYCCTELKRLISESNLPFLVDITEYSSLPESFQKEIQKKGIVFYPRCLK